MRPVLAKLSLVGRNMSSRQALAAMGVAVAAAVALGILLLVLAEGRRNTELPNRSYTSLHDEAESVDSPLTSVTQKSERIVTRPTEVLPARADSLLVITGQVVDDLGKPVPDFAIRASRPGVARDEMAESFEGLIDGAGESTQEKLRSLLAKRGDGFVRRFANSDGTFRLEGLAVGRWCLLAQSSSGRISSSIETKGEERIILVLPRGAVLIGVVTDVSGAAVQNASLYLAAANAKTRVLPGNSSPQARTGGSGSFTISDVHPGRVQLMASHPKYSNSEWVEVVVLPGERRVGIQIALTRGGRIEGRLDESLGNVSGREISLFSFRENLGWRDTKTDRSGRFVIEGVIPQEYVIELRPEGFDSTGSEHRPGVRRNILVKEGETTEVAFADARNQIAAHGRITASGLPVSGVTVSAASKEVGEERSEEFTADDAGHYELTLNGPGTYWFGISRGDSIVGFERAVPDEASVELDFEVPSGLISGRILDADGKPLARAPVSLLREEEDSKTFWSRHSRLYTGSDGSFEFSMLSRGTYTLRAPDGYWQDSPPPRVPYGRVLRAGLVIDDHPIVGLEVRLREEGRASGLVVDSSGHPVVGAWIVLKDGDGLSISAYCETQTNAGGRFEIPSLAPGIYTAHARSDSLEGHGEVFTVAAGQTSTTRIVLR